MLLVINIITVLKIVFLVCYRLDDELEMSLVRARTEYEKAAAKVDVNVQEFKGYGKDFLKTSQIHPEAFIQIALQAAYILLHGKPAPTYCTASTRGFYRGRTETCRSCSQEVGRHVLVVSSFLSRRRFHMRFSAY